MIIKRYTIPPDQKFDLELPSGSLVIGAGLLAGSPVLWVKVDLAFDPDEPDEDNEEVEIVTFHFLRLRTDEPVDDDAGDWAYVETVVYPSGIEFHLYYN